MKKISIFLSLLFFAVFSVLLLGFTGCEKDTFKESIIGKWKLEKVTYFDSTGYLSFSEFEDYSENNIIYELKHYNYKETYFYSSHFAVARCGKRNVFFNKFYSVCIAI